MSLLSVTCTAGIKAVIYLAVNDDRASIVQISEAIDASTHTIGKLLQTLVKAGVICSVKGPSGGFYLTAKQKNQSIINVIDAIDGREVFDRCGLGLSKCSSSHPCPVHEQYKQVRDDFKSMCRQARVVDLCEPVVNGFSYLAG